MRVLQINSVGDYGSTGKIAIDIAKVLETSGNESLIAYARYAKPMEVKSIKISSDLDVKVHGIFARLFDCSGFASNFVTKKAIKKFKKYDPDIIQLHNIHGYYLNVPMLFDYLKVCGKPIVWTLHDCWSFTGHCAYFDYTTSGNHGPCDKWKTGCKNCPNIKEYPASMLVDRSKNNYKHKREIFTGVPNLTLVTPSMWLADKVKESFLSEYDIKVINNGIDTLKIKPSLVSIDALKDKYGLAGKFVVLGMASVWEPRKGLDDFIAVAKEVDDKGVGFVLVGLNETQLKNLPKNIIGIERTNNLDELLDIYTLSDVFLNTTLDDNYPTTNLEARACGTPVITYRTGGSPESAGENAIVVEKRNIHKAAQAIEDIKDGRVKIEEDKAPIKTKEDMAFDYLKLYEGIIK